MAQQYKMYSSSLRKGMDARALMDGPMDDLDAAFYLNSS